MHTGRAGTRRGSGSSPRCRPSTQVVHQRVGRGLRLVGRGRGTPPSTTTRRSRGSGCAAPASRAGRSGRPARRRARPGAGCGRGSRPRRPRRRAGRRRSRSAGPGRPAISPGAAAGRARARPRRGPGAAAPRPRHRPRRAASHAVTSRAQAGAKSGAVTGTSSRSPVPSPGRNTEVTRSREPVACPQHGADGGETCRHEGSGQQSGSRQRQRCHPERRALLPGSYGGSVDGYYAFMLVATAFVLMMTVPALALFYGGMSRSKSVLNMMMMSYVAFAVVGIVFVRRLVEGLRRRRRRRRSSHGPFDLFWLDGVAHRQLHLRAVPADVRGHHGRADQGRDRGPGEVRRLGRLRAGLADALLLPDRPHGLRLHRRLAHLRPRSARRTTRVARSCTSTPVSRVCVLAPVIGKRVGFGKDPMRPHNLTLTMIGAGLLWFGWYGFNVGSIVFTGCRPTGRTPRSSCPRPASRS